MKKKILGLCLFLLVSCFAFAKQYTLHIDYPSSMGNVTFSRYMNEELHKLIKDNFHIDQVLFSAEKGEMKWCIIIYSDNE